MIPKYFSLKEKINEDIVNGKYPLGSNLPTEVQLAAIYKVSRSTVRQALNLLVSDGIIEKKWGSGNTVISISNSIKKSTVMLIIPDKSKNDRENAIVDMTSLLLKEGYSLEIMTTEGKFAKEREYLRELTKDMYGGLIIATTQSHMPSPNSDLIQLLLKRKLPVIFVGSHPKDIYNVSTIAFDDYDRGYQNARRFINMGYKKVGGIFLYDDEASVSSFHGFVDAIRDANLPVLDDCYLWCPSFERPGANLRSTVHINRFLKNALKIASAIYSDDGTLTFDGTFPVYLNGLTPAKSIGKEIAKQFLAQKKNGNNKNVTIPYK